VALFVAEDIGTLTGTWLHAGNASRRAVSFAKFGSWYLLSWVAFVTVTLVSAAALSRAPVTGSRASAAPPPATPPPPAG
jgi:uncharacterized membrane protein YoaT (DUF817 family)